MPSTFRGPLLCGLIAIFTAFAAVASAAPVRLVRGTDASATPAEATFLRDRFWRVPAFKIGALRRAAWTFAKGVSSGVGTHCWPLVASSSKG